MKDYDKTLLLALQASADSHDIYDATLKNHEENIQNFVSMLDKLDSFIKAPCTLDAIREEMRGRRYQIELHITSERLKIFPSMRCVSSIRIRRDSRFSSMAASSVDV